MHDDLGFSLLLIHPQLHADSLAGVRLRELITAFEQRGQAVLATAELSEGQLIASSQHGLAAILLGAEDAGSDAPRLQAMSALLHSARQRAPHLPLFALGEQLTLEQAPPETFSELGQWRGILYLFEDSVAFLAAQVLQAIEHYFETLLPPFFRTLRRYSARARHTWHTPGHGGGVAYRKSPVGLAFQRFFGENTLRADLSVSVGELGSLLDHSGPLAAAEQRAARIFAADHSFFVINGTSTANKIVWHALVSRGDLVLVDRNCHKSVVHALVMTGAIPLYLEPARNALGLIGPVPLEEFSQAAIAAKIAACPQAAGRAPRVRLVLLTHSTYDGLCYNLEQICRTLGASAEVLHVDEAWFAYAAFHPFYAERFAMGVTRSAGEPMPLVCSTQSSHKMLAAFSQASMIHVRNAPERTLDVARFNEAFMMHTSTSPQYAILASLDVAAAMMEGEAGQSLIQECHDEALAFRRAMARLRAGLVRGDWWFELWQPPQATGATTLQSADWVLESEAHWHGFGALASEHVLLDPLKVTLVTPGLMPDGQLAAQGIPARVLSRFLHERGVVVEKTGLYSLLVLFSMGVTKGKWSSLITELLTFKRLHDGNAPLEEALPSLLADEPQRYRGLGLRDLCQQLHEAYRRARLPALLEELHRQRPPMVLTPAEAFERLVRGAVEAVPLEALPGRVAAVILVPYPPGIALILPGERFGTLQHSLIDYLRAVVTLADAFPGFRSEVQGLREHEVQGARRYTVDCLLE
ncbi:Orn/Lys/Arg decarboxylase N-terminal domain-containing protein [Pseudomonas sp. NW5]|uniref:Orn/Lys/Arg family decarboxylase n=1 Tax=Pseudomonas sp. NW5 TaxID=2934934 RepID=UPI002020C0DE|nr:Orn/Lys/Arg decarboxylase N-terminal domain-containing protein [Pseudomonas sp. NW5]MCL7462010.1 lysine decarboxylase [Pseudomonas sp. NW5]